MLLMAQCTCLRGAHMRHSDCMPPLRSTPALSAVPLLCTSASLCKSLPPPGAGLTFQKACGFVAAHIGARTIDLHKLGGAEVVLQYLQAVAIGAEVGTALHDQDTRDAQLHVA